MTLELTLTRRRTPQQRDRGKQAGVVDLKGINATEVQAMVGNQTPKAFGDLPGAARLKKSGLRVFGVTMRRVPVFPDASKITGPCVPGPKVNLWCNLLVPVKTSIRVLSQPNAAESSPDVRKRFSEPGMKQYANSLEQTDKLLRAETAKCDAVIGKARSEPH